MIIKCIYKIKLEEGVGIIWRDSLDLLVLLCSSFSLEHEDYFKTLDFYYVFYVFGRQMILIFLI